MQPFCPVLCLVLLSSVSCTANAPSPQIVTFYNDDSAPTPEMAEQHGYRCQTHQVETADGYILHIHRLPGGRVTPLDPHRHPVLLQHGFMDSSADWLIGGPDRALAYLLADQGYDVWLGNVRGNIYSRTHKKLLPKDPNFWNWTWHEMGQYDLPAVIDHILQVTGRLQLFYVGHSMGTTMFFVLCTTRPEYNDKVRYMAALAPVAFLSHATSPIKYLAPLANSFEKIADYFGKGAFLPRDGFMNILFKLTCEALRFEERICENYLFLICGYDPDQFDENLIPVIIGHNPAGTSTKTLVHYAQEIRSSNFHQYDYGAERNIILYNSTTPPQYNLSLVTVPMSLHYGDNDLLAQPMDVKILFSRLQNPVQLLRVNLSSFNHLDFLWARDAKSLVFNKVESLLKDHEDSRI